MFSDVIAFGMSSTLQIQTIFVYNSLQRRWFCKTQYAIIVIVLLHSPSVLSWIEHSTNDDDNNNSCSQIRFSGNLRITINLEDLIQYPSLKPVVGPLCKTKMRVDQRLALRWRQKHRLTTEEDRNSDVQGTLLTLTSRYALTGKTIHYLPGQVGLLLLWPRFNIRGHQY